jgi:hypothetical protein
MCMKSDHADKCTPIKLRLGVQLNFSERESCTPFVRISMCSGIKFLRVRRQRENAHQKDDRAALGTSSRVFSIISLLGVDPFAFIVAQLCITPKITISLPFRITHIRDLLIAHCEFVCPKLTWYAIQKEVEYAVDYTPPKSFYCNVALHWFKK